MTNERHTSHPSVLEPFQELEESYKLTKGCLSGSWEGNYKGFRSYVPGTEVKSKYIL